MPASPREEYGKEYRADVADFKKGTMSYSQRAALPDMTFGLSWGDRFFDDRLGIVLREFSKLQSGNRVPFLRRQYAAKRVDGTSFVNERPFLFRDEDAICLAYEK